jgi:hypothetical protein
MRLINNDEPCADRGTLEDETMETNNSNILSPAEVEFLKVEADDYGWYVWTDRTRPMIQALCARHLMAANGDFKVVGANDTETQKACLVGHASPRVGSLLRYFELIGVGRVAFRALHSQPTFTAGSAPLAPRLPTIPRGPTSTQTEAHRSLRAA